MDIAQTVDLFSEKKDGCRANSKNGKCIKKDGVVTKSRSTRRETQKIEEKRWGLNKLQICIKKKGVEKEQYK